MHIAHMHISNVLASLQLGAMLLKKWLQRQCAVIDSALRMGRASCSAVCEGSVKRDSSSQLERLVCTPPTMDLILSQPLLSCLNCGICETLFAWRSQEHRNNHVACPLSIVQCPVKSPAAAAADDAKDGVNAHWLFPPPLSTAKSLPLPFFLLLPLPTPGKTSQRSQFSQRRFLSQATGGPTPECAGRLQLQLPGGREAEASQAGERGEHFYII